MSDKLDELKGLDRDRLVRRSEGKRRSALPASLVAGFALLVCPSGLLAQNAASVRISAEVLVVPEMALIDRGGTGETQSPAVALAGQSAASVQASLVQGSFVRLAVQREANIFRSRIDFIAN